MLFFLLIPSIVRTIQYQYHKFSYEEVMKKDELFESEYRNFNGEEKKQIKYHEKGIISLIVNSTLIIKLYMIKASLVGCFFVLIS